MEYITTQATRDTEIYSRASQPQHYWHFKLDPSLLGGCLCIMDA